MGQFSHEQVLGLLVQLADNTKRSGTLTVRDVVPVGSAVPAWFCPWASDAPGLAWTMSHDNFFSLIKCVPSLTDNSHSYIELLGGGAWGVVPDPRLFPHLTNRAADFHHGGAFSGTAQDGTVTYGLRATITGQVFWDESASAAYAYVADTLIGLGVAARIIAQELVPHFGGNVFDREDQQSDLRLLWSVSGRQT